MHNDKFVLLLLLLQACSLLTALLFAVLELVVLFCCSANKEY